MAKKVLRETPPELLQGIKDLKTAREYITPPSKWIKGTWSQGDMDNPNVKVCSMGALDKAMRLNGQVIMSSEIQQTCAFSFLGKAALAATPAYKKNRDFGPIDYIILTNDNPNTTHEQVLAMFDKAIKMAEQSAKDASKGK